MPNSSQNRLVWIDVAKALAIVLVVFHHVALSGAQVLLPAVSPEVQGTLAQLTRALLPIRMPLFFFVSGILASSAIFRSFKDVSTPRYLNLLWPYILWSIVFAFVAAPRYRPNNMKGWTLDTLSAIPFGGTAYWFLSILVAFFALAQLLKKFLLPTWFVCVALFAIAPLIGSFLGDHTALPQSLVTNLQRFAYFAIWYFLGLIIASNMRRISMLFNPVTVVTLIVLYVVMAYSFYFMGIGKSLGSAIYQMLAFLGVCSFIGISVALSKIATLAKVAQYIASRTLAIYVLHPILIGVTVVVLRLEPFEGFVNLPLWVLVQYLYYPILTILYVWVSMWIFNVAQRTRMRWLFSWPIPARQKAPRVPTNINS